VSITQKITSLPKWAQERIVTLERERQTALDALNKWVNEQTEAPMWIDEMKCLGEERKDGSDPPSFKRRYIQTRRIAMNHAGVRLDVSLVDNEIRLQWSVESGAMRNVAMIPHSYQSVTLVAKEHMR